MNTSPPRAVRSRAIAGLGALALAINLAACTGSGQTSGATGDKSGTPGGSASNLRIAVAEAPDNLDPDVAQSNVSTDIDFLFAQGLYTMNANSEVVPVLATAMPEYSKDRLTVTIPLRTGVKFNDGTDFNAEAVVKSWAQSKDLPGSTVGSALTRVASYEAKDANTLVFHMKEPYGPFANDLMYANVTSPTQRAKLGSKFATDPVGVGPYEFDSQVPNVSVTLKKSPYYYNKTAVKFNTIQFKIITDDNAREIALKSGTVDFAEKIRVNSVASLKKDTGLEVDAQKGGGWTALQINVANKNGLGKPQVPLSTPLAKSKDLREALALSLDRKAITTVTSNGLDVPSCSPIGSTSPFFRKVDCPSQDIAKAKQLVASSGYKTPINISLSTYTDSTLAKAAQAIQAMAGQVGFKVSINNTEKVTYQDRVDSGNYDVALYTWNGGPDPNVGINLFFEALPVGVLDVTGFQNDQVTALLKKNIASTETSDRADLYQQALNLINANYSTIYLYNQTVVSAHRSGLSGVAYSPTANLVIADDASFK